MKILTWNINGIRAVQRDGTCLKKLLNSLDADVICFQETKVTRDMLDEPTAIVEGYDSFFGFSRKKTGYSGTANYCRVGCLPSRAEEGLTGRLTGQLEGCVGRYANTNCFTGETLDGLDDEGRCVITQHKVKLPDGQVKEVAIINVYVPRAGESEERLEYKLKFLTLLQLRAESLLAHGIHVIVLGDINTTHTGKDHCDPQSNEEYIRRSSRIWFNQFLRDEEKDPTVPKTDGRYADYVETVEADVKGGLFSDVFRRLHPQRENAFTNWCTMTGARQTNYGRRLDYILVDSHLAQFSTACEILADVHGSDHCPVILTLNCTPVPSSLSPALNSKCMPEFRGQQKKLSEFFNKIPASNSNGTPIKSDSKSNLGNSLLKDKSSGTLLSSPKKTLPSEPSQKRQSSSKNQAHGKKAKLQKEDSKQISLNFFYQSTSKPKKSQEKHEESSLAVNKDFFQSTETGNECTEVESLPDSARISAKEGKGQTVVAPSGLGKRSSSGSNASTLTAWKSILSGLPPAPLCPGHKEPSLLRTVKKEGPNKNKQFYVCCRPDGAPGNIDSRCDFFQWLNAKKR